MSTANEMHKYWTDSILGHTDELYQPTVTMKYSDHWETSMRYGLGVMSLAEGTPRQVPPHVPERVIYNGTTTIAIFPDGKKIISRPDKGAVFDKETGLAMCIVKHVYGTRAKFLKAVNKANDQNKDTANA